MAFTRQRKHCRKRDVIERPIVKSKRSLIRKIIEVVISFIIWGYMFIVVYFFVSASVGYNNEFIGIVKAAFKVTNEDIRRFIGKSILYFIMCLIGLFLWKVYNTKRYGHLNRREHPPNTLDQEMIELGLVQEAIYHRLQNEQVIIFEKNPIKDMFEVD